MSKNLIALIIILIFIIIMLSVYFFVYNVNNTQIISKSNEDNIYPPNRAGYVGVTVLPINQSDEEGNLND